MRISYIPTGKRRVKKKAIKIGQRKSFCLTITVIYNGWKFNRLSIIINFQNSWERVHDVVENYLISLKAFFLTMCMKKKWGAIKGY